LPCTPLCLGGVLVPEVPVLLDRVAIDKTCHDLRALATFSR